jgi:GNAT superfamily N-acetyltransferase
MSIEEIRIRAAGDDDQAAIEEIVRLGLADLRKVYRPTQAALDNTEARALTGRLVAEIAGRVVGTTGYRREKETLHIIGLFVHPEYRHRGVARQIVRSLASVAYIQGRTSLSLNTIRQTGNVTIFEKLDFRVKRETPVTDAESLCGEALTEVYMARPI